MTFSDFIALPPFDLRIRDLEVGATFRFQGDNPAGHPWQYRGNGFFGWPYSGGPYYEEGNPLIILLASAD